MTSVNQQSYLSRLAIYVPGRPCLAVGFLFVWVLKTLPRGPSHNGFNKDVFVGKPLFFLKTIVVWSCFLLDATVVRKYDDAYVFFSVTLAELKEWRKVSTLLWTIPVWTLATKRCAYRSSNSWSSDISFVLVSSKFSCQLQKRKDTRALHISPFPASGALSKQHLSQSQVHWASVHNGTGTKCSGHLWAK